MDKKTWAVSAMAVNPQERVANHSLYVFDNMSSEAEALGNAIVKAKKELPEDKGWQKHDFLFQEVKFVPEVLESKSGSWSWALSEMGNGKEVKHPYLGNKPIWMDGITLMTCSQKEHTGGCCENLRYLSNGEMNKIRKGWSLYEIIKDEEI